MSTYIQNYGVTKSYIQKNNKKSVNELKWKGNYDGQQANIELLVNDDGHFQHMQMKLNNEELMELLNIQPIEHSLEQRLLDDFIPKQELYLYNEPFITTNKFRTKTKKSKTKKSKTKSKRSKTKSNKSKK
jgi:divalent metal cation (Fe/Co/Zn/Cd) transporter